MSTDWIDLDDVPDDLDWTSRRTLVLARDNWRCQYCGEHANHVDHKWPQSWGGTDDLDNLQALCGACNRAKGDKAQFRYLNRSQAYATATHSVDKAITAILKGCLYRRIHFIIDGDDDGERAYQEAGKYGTLDDLDDILGVVLERVRSYYPARELPLKDLHAGQIVRVNGHGKREFRVRWHEGELVEAVDLHTGGLRTFRREQVAA